MIYVEIIFNLGKNLCEEESEINFPGQVRDSDDHRECKDKPKLIPGIIKFYRFLRTHIPKEFWAGLKRLIPIQVQSSANT